MLQNESKFPLSSYNEWGTLKEIIVGRPFSKKDILVDYSFCHFNFDNVNEHLDIIERKKADKNNCSGFINFKEEYLKELNEDIEEFVKALQCNGVNVLRPKQIDTNQVNFSTPYWSSSLWPALNVRDRFLILGNNIVETTPCIRARYFETDLLKEHLYKFFLNGANWLCMPKPIMTDSSFDKTYINNHPNKTASRELIEKNNSNYYDVGIEILMDAANCLRVGKDVIVNVADKNQYFAFQWLQHSLGDKFNFHMLDSITDNHIDSYIIIIRPGLLLLRNKSVLQKLPSFMKNWKCIIAPEAKESCFPQYDSDSLIITSKYIDTNILSLNENKVIANSLNPELIDLLIKNGVEVVPVRHRHRRLFGGGFHCFTLDTYRESECILYR